LTLEDPQGYRQRVPLPRDKLRTEIPQQRVCGHLGAFPFYQFKPKTPEVAAGTVPDITPGNQ
jgi:hypothetical protein